MSGAHAYCAAVLDAAQPDSGEPFDLDVAGVGIGLRFRGPRARDLISPLAHLAARSSAEPGWALHVRDCGGSAEIPPLPFETPAAGPGGTAYFRYQDEEISILREARSGCVWALDAPRRIAAALIPDLSSLPAAENDSRLRQPLQMILSASGRPLVHGGLVGIGDRGALLPGRSGAGKSTLAIACVRAGLDFCSDDYIALVPGENRAYGLLPTAKLTREAAGLLELPSDANGRPWHYEDRGGPTPKATVDISDLAGVPVRTSMEIAMIIVPRIGDEVTTPRLDPVRPAAAVRALVPTLIQQPTRDPLLLPALASLAGSVPCYDFHMVAAPDVNADALRTALAPGPVAR